MKIEHNGVVINLKLNHVHIDTACSMCGMSFCPGGVVVELDGYWHRMICNYCVEREVDAGLAEIVRLADEGYGLYLDRMHAWHEEDANRRELPGYAEIETALAQRAAHG